MKKQKLPKGRPTKLTPELQKELCKLISLGNYIETAAAFCGINKTTVYDWMKRGARAKEKIEKGQEVPESELPFIDFSNAIQKALATSEIRDVQIISKAAQTNWQAAAWRLERKFPDRWGRRDRVETEHKITIEDFSKALDENAKDVWEDDGDE